MVVAPVDPDVDEAEQVCQEPRGRAAERCERGLSGTFSSRTMMVMMMARTPSLNASSRLVRIRAVFQERVNQAASLTGHHSQVLRGVGLVRVDQIEWLIRSSGSWDARSMTC